MNKKQYQLMEWEKIEAITYADCEHPFEILGLHTVEKERFIQAYYPAAEKVVLNLFKAGTKTSVDMECVDDNGFYCLFVTDYDFDEYSYDVYFEDGEEKDLLDPYAYVPEIDRAEIARVLDGTSLNAEGVLGSKFTKVAGKDGVLFSVYAPNANRVSLVGNFNNWIATANLMEKDSETGVFYLFVPGLKEGQIYQYNISVKGGECNYKADPFAFLLKGNDSVLCNLQVGKENTSRKDLKKEETDFGALNIYEADISAALTKDSTKKDIKAFVTYIKKLKFNCVKLLPFAGMDETKRDRFHALSLFATDYEIGINTVTEFINECHKSDLTVVMDLNISFFSTLKNGMGRFDGTALFEHADARIGYQPSYDGFMYQLAGGLSRSYIYSAVKFYIDVYHIDGFAFSNLAPLMYLDYGRSEYILNEFGGNINLEAVDFIKGLNAYLDENYPDIIKIAEMSAVFENITGSPENSLGFDYALNTGFSGEMIEYGRMNPFFKGINYGQLFKHISYAFNENFILPFSYVDAMSDGVSFVSRMCGTREEQFKQAKAFYALRCFYPGKQLTFMNVAAGIEKAYSFDSKFDYFDEGDALRQGFVKCVADINDFYLSNAILKETDSNPSSLCFVNAYDNKNTIVIFERLGKKENELLLVVANFSANSFEEYRLGAKKPGKYKEIINTDSAVYAGSGISNVKEVVTNEDEYDGRSQSIDICIPPMSVLAFEYIPFTKAEIAAIEERKRKEQIKLLKEKIKEIEDERDKAIALANEIADSKLCELNSQLKELEK